jgi:hypothetical protein
MHVCLSLKNVKNQYNNSYYYNIVEIEPSSNNFFKE